jgi:hypothetical protein
LLARGHLVTSDLPLQLYRVTQLPADYQRLWRRALNVSSLGFADVLELLTWELFSEVIRVEEDASQTNKE